MLDVQRFQPLMPPTHSRRHRPIVIERGRSRDVSPAALTRKASEERRRRAARIVSIQVEVACAPNRATSPIATPRHVSSPHKTKVDHSIQQPQASSSSLTTTTTTASSSSSSLPSCSHSSPSASTVVSSSTSESSTSSLNCIDNDDTQSLSSDQSSTSAKEEQEDEEEDVVMPSLSLQDEMQEAYAACQSTCSPRVTASRNHRCPHIHRARILCLRTRGIEVTSDHDPRINAIRDEDFIFVPPGFLTLDEDTQAAVEAERARREKEVAARQQRLAKEQAEKRKMQEARRRELENAAVRASYQRLEFTAKKARPTRTNAAGPQQTTLKHAPRLIAPASFKPVSSPERNGTPPGHISFKTVVRSLRGPLFPEEDASEIRCQRPRTAAQERLLDSLLEPVTWEGERRSQLIRSKDFTNARTWSYKPSSLDPTCVACSIGSDSTISRTNSWASSTSDEQTSSTNITSPSSSPSFGKLQLPPLVEDKVFRQRQVSHSCRPLRGIERTSIALSESPLGRKGDEQTKSEIESNETSTGRQKVMSIKSKLVNRMRQSVVGFVDFASRVQQSYMRTVQFSVTMPDASMAAYYTAVDESQSTGKRNSGERSHKPEGYRASVSDVRSFAPQPVYPPTRDLNFASETNIPLVEPDVAPSSTLVPGQPRVFAPLAFVPPSPLRPRYALTQPEWRLRPVANPCMLRLKALANVLGNAGIAWEGRAHSGSLGCGRERLTGVAFEGLGGSRLAFEDR